LITARRDQVFRAGALGTYGARVILFLVRSLMLFLAALIGIFVTSLVLADFKINFPSVVLAAVIFAVVQAVMFPFMISVTRRNAPALIGAVGLLTAFVALLVTSIFSNGIEVSGVQTWIIGTLIVWLATMVATLFLPILLVKMGLTKAAELRENNSN